MYENTNSSIDWKGLFLKVVIAFLIVIIAITGYKTFKNSNNTNKNNTTTKVAETNTSTTFTANIEKLREAGEKYFNNNKNKVPTKEGVTSMVTLNELISSGSITSLTDEDGKTCNGESSYVTAFIEGKETKIKANLVCGESTSYSIVHLGENDSEVKEQTTITNTTSNSTDKTPTTNTKTSSNSNTKCTTCTVNIKTETKVDQNVSFNKDNNSSNNTSSNKNEQNYTTKNYTVSFDKNGGTTYYRTKYVKEGNTVEYPGDNYKSGYVFDGWYLNGKLFDFNTPITRDITLVAEYSRKGSSNNSSRYLTDTFTTLVYTMGWDTKGTDEIEITHTLRLPEDEIEEIEDDNNISIEEIRIEDIRFVRAITDSTDAKRHDNLHKNTFLYDYSDKNWFSQPNTKNSLATILERDVYFDFGYSDNYKDLYDAEDEGFEVTWGTDNVYKQCSKSFDVNGETNKCNYGIVYEVTWQYRYDN